MNVELLRKIAAVIQEKPAEFDMDNWHYNAKHGCAGKPMKACGTTHCIAGWAHLIDGRLTRTFTMFAAPKILDLDEDQAGRLFYAEQWPEQFDHKSPASAAARIEHFIATGGAE